MTKKKNCSLYRCFTMFFILYYVFRLSEEFDHDVAVYTIKNCCYDLVWKIICHFLTGTNGKYILQELSVTEGKQTL